jgi:ribose transport system permease protein
MTRLSAGGMRASMTQHWSAAIGVALLVALVLVGIVTISGFWSLSNLRSTLVLASFLGIASIGQTLCALVGGLDLSIPFVIGAANVGLLGLMNRGLSSGVAIVVTLVLAAVVGVIGGGVSYRQQGQSLVVTLGVGTAFLGLVQILVSSQGNSGIAGGTIQGNVPGWLQTFSSLRSPVGVAPSVFLWVGLSILTMVLLRRTWVGRGLYALGGNRIAAKRAMIPELGIWILVFGLSAVTAAATGILLLGFTGGGYAGVGQPYLFTTLAAVVIGGTSLVGGRGGYGLTILGVLILTVLQTILAGFSLSAAAQEAILGAIIVPMVALYARGPHPRMQI